MKQPPAIGILGGTFDPIHYGHLRLAEEAADQLQLGAVRFIPAGQPYHRDGEAASGEHRLAMARLALAGNSRFVLDDLEVQRDGPAYTVDTLRQLRAQTGAAPLVLLMGADAFRGIAAWHRWREIFSLAHIAIFTRAGMSFDGLDLIQGELRSVLDGRITSDKIALHHEAAGCVIALPMTPLEISATQIRDLLRRRQSARYLLPAAVLEYIQSRHLYAT